MIILPYIFVLLWNLDKKITLTTIYFVLCVICIRNRFTKFHKKSPGRSRNSLYCHLHLYCLYTKTAGLWAPLKLPPQAPQGPNLPGSSPQAAPISSGFPSAPCIIFPRIPCPERASGPGEQNKHIVRLCTIFMCFTHFCPGPKV